MTTKHETTPQVTGSCAKVYHLSVDYRRSIEDGVKAGRYKMSHPDIISKNFPPKRKRMAEVVLELVHFNRCISTANALRELRRMGYRPANLSELLTFGEKYPEVQFEFPIVALGSIWRDRRGYRRVPFLIGGPDSQRRLLLYWDIGEPSEAFQSVWLEPFRFAAVRKPSLSSLLSSLWKTLVSKVSKYFYFRNL